MQYPESLMNVAVHMGEGEVRIFGHEKNGYRQRLETMQLPTKPDAIMYCSEHNKNARFAIGLVRR